MKRVVSSSISIVFFVTTLIITVHGEKAISTADTLRVSLPVKEGSVRFAVIGDTGSGSSKQQQVAQMMVEYRKLFPFEFVLMMGDNLYGGESAEDYQEKFENVYRPLLDAKVKFYATLGNHDEPNQRMYEHFNMDGKEYYRFKKGKISFYALNSNYMDKRQVKWLEDELSRDTSEWKVCFFHHPPYSSGKKHGADEQLREVVEPIFLKHGVDVVLAGHEHFYERIRPQKGIHYFISGAGGKLRTGNVRRSNITAKSFDADMHFILMEAFDDQLHFQVISRLGKTVDAGVVIKRGKTTAATSSE